MHNTAYSLWPVNSYQQSFRSVINFGFGGQECNSKLPQVNANRSTNFAIPYFPNHLINSFTIR